MSAGHGGRPRLARHAGAARWGVLLVAALAGTAIGAPTGHLVSVRDSPGYRPLVDADSMAERLGRRMDAPRVEVPFRGGARSLEALATAVLGALHASSVDSLLRLSVSEAEFRDVLWREFPQSRPATGLHWDDAWPVLFGRLNGGSVASVREYGNRWYRLVRVEQRETVPYRNFRLHNGIVIVAKDDEGREVRYATIRSVAERRGRFKIYSMDD